MLATPGLNKKLPLGRPSREAGLSAMEALRKSLGLMQARQGQALVTAPVSKESFHLMNMGFPGHTEWLAHATDSPSAIMLMLAGPLRAVLMTRHVPLKEVGRHLTIDVVRDAAVLAHKFVKESIGKTRPRIVACGVNPHAGDAGLMGLEEKEILVPALRALARQGLHIAGPLPADSVFRDMAQGRYDLALAAYHDQGMIPLKLYAFNRLVNVTLGLPFIRTSPGHGTAYDIVGKNRADAGPMIEAIRLAAQFSAS